MVDIKLPKLTPIENTEAILREYTSVYIRSFLSGRGINFRRFSKLSKRNQKKVIHKHIGPDTWVICKEFL